MQMHETLQTKGANLNGPLHLKPYYYIELLINVFLLYTS